MAPLLGGYASLRRGGPFLEAGGAEEEETVLSPRAPGMLSRFGASWRLLALAAALTLGSFALLSGGPAGDRGGALPVLELEELGAEAKFALFPSTHFSPLNLVLKAWQKMFGIADPFLFQCPLPLAVRGIAGESGRGEMSARDCCGGYESLEWPYQFPACAEYSNCSSCRRRAPEGALLREHGPTARLAGAAWAAVVTTRGQAKPKWGSVLGKLQQKLTSMSGASGEKTLEGHRMEATLGSGLASAPVDVCPNVGDWDIVMLHASGNIHVRVFKSRSAKVAVVAFRGTQATSMKNWQVDADIDTIGLDLDKEPSGAPSPGGRVAQVHEGFLLALLKVSAQVQKWVECNKFPCGVGPFSKKPVPEDWKLVFTGHSLGGALAILAASMAEADSWKRKPDAVITFGTPRVGDKTLSDWWEQRGMCSKLLRVTAYNDVIHWFPFRKMWSWWRVFADLKGCSDGACKESVAFSDSERWMHVCEGSEFLVPGAMRGLNDHLEDFSPVGAILSHFVSNCLFGYGYGVMHHSGIAEQDSLCGIGPQMCPAPQS